MNDLFTKIVFYLNKSSKERLFSAFRKTICLLMPSIWLFQFPLELNFMNRLFSHDIRFDSISLCLKVHFFLIN